MNKGQITKGNRAAVGRGNPSTLTAAGRRKKLEEAIWWVADHELTDEPPSELHRKLQSAWRKDESTFMRDFVKQVLAAKDAETEAEAEEGEEDYLKILDEVLAEMEGRPREPVGSASEMKENACPHCNGTGERPNDGSVKALAHAVKPGSQVVQR